jgi:AcrR family transcriptional regulator
VSTDAYPIASGAWRQNDPLELPPTLAPAMEMFGKFGYHGTGVRKVANRAGVTIPALYYHHKSKQGMLIALLNVAMDDLLARARAAVVEAGDQVDQRFDNLIEAIVLHMTYRIEFARLDSEIRYLEPENRVRYAAQRAELERLLEDTIQSGVDLGKFDVTHVRDTTRAILGMLAAVVGWYRADGPLTAAQIAARYVEIARSTVRAK